MNNRTFKCTFLSDIVLNMNTATEGNSKSLDYIPGACFLGIVAKNYDDVSNSYDIFHSGKVRFGDAHIAKGNRRSLKRPASWFFEKSDMENSEIYIHHYITDEMRKEFKQLKQVRSGYFIEGDLITVKHDFSIKSAYNADERRSSDGQLYGYDALRKGSEWIFNVESENAALLAEVADYLVGDHNIGRSKTAQYGRVKIENLDEFKGNHTTLENDRSHLALYFESSAAFVDENGNPTYQPSISDLGMISGNIDWAASQVLTRTFSPWNFKRKVRDADKVCIDKGSVIIVKNGVADREKISQGIGVYRNEGFGKVIVNPGFLKADGDDARLANPPKTQNDEKNIVVTAIADNAKEDERILAWIEKRATLQDRYAKVVEATNEFMKKHKNKFNRISSSQWGGIRERAQRISNLEVLDNELFRQEINHTDDRGIKVIDDRGGYLRHGKAEHQWRACFGILQSRLKTVKEKISEETARRFLINLCSEMAKKASKGN